MKNRFYFLFFIGILIFSYPVRGQNVIVVDPDDPLNPGNLNRAIEAVDSADLSNTIFELKRDGLYLLNGTLSNPARTILHIRGQEGAGSRPVLQPAIDVNQESSRILTPGGSLTLERLYLQGRDEIGNIESQPIRVAGDSSRIIIDDCFIDYSAQSIVRTNSKDNTIIITNSIIRNSILPDNPSNGRVIDTRGNPNDTLWISDCTIYNGGATQLRSDGGFTLFANFDHNTVYQTSFNHNFAMDIIFKANVTNNIFYNFLYRGTSMTHDAFFRLDSMFTIGDKSDADRYFDFSNNNWYTQKEIGDILDQYGPDDLWDFYEWDTAPFDTIWYREVKRTDWFANDTLLEITPPEYRPEMLNFIDNGQVDTANLFHEELTFKNPPPLNLAYWKFYTENGWTILGMETPDAYADEDSLVMGEVTSGAYDFSYNAGSRSATAADGGLPLGASRWVPDPSLSTNPVRLTNFVRTFPNPAEDQITFSIECRESTKMKIQVFDLLGRELHTVYGTVNQGDNDFVVSLEPLAHPGVFLYQILFETKSGMKSVSSGKFIKK